MQRLRRMLRLAVAGMVRFMGYVPSLTIRCMRCVHHPAHAEWRAGEGEGEEENG